MRITMSMVSRQYSKNLNNSLSQLNTAANRSTTFRKFDKASEDPFSASKAYRLRSEFQQKDDYLNNLNDVEDQLTTANSAMQSVHKIVSGASSGDCIQAINGTLAQEDRAVIATKLRGLQKAIIAPANTMFGDKYIFGGSGTTNPPFTVGANGNLLYRGIDVNTGKIEAGTSTTMNGSQIAFGKGTGESFNGYTIKVADGGVGSSDDVSLTGKEITVKMDLTAGKTNKDLLNALKNKTGLSDTGGTPLDFSNISMSGDLNRPLELGTPNSTVATDTIGLDGLKNISNEKCFVDLGMGLSLNADGKTINEQSVFDTSIPGITFMGFGTTDGTKTGVSNNLYTLLGNIADQLESKDFSMDKIQPYLDNFSKQVQNSLSQITKSGTKSNFLTTTKAQLETISDNVNEKLHKTEFLEVEDAVMDYNWQQYTYSAALKIGTQILQPTFLDFMR